MFALLMSQVALGATIERVSPSQAAQMQQSNEAVILDVRETDEWNAGHIAGAIHIPLGEMQGRMSEIARYKNSSVITQCRSGTRSEKAAQAPCLAAGGLSCGGFKRASSAVRHLWANL